MNLVFLLLLYLLIIIPIRNSQKKRILCKEAQNIIFTLVYLANMNGICVKTKCYPYCSAVCCWLVWKQETEPEPQWEDPLSPTRD